MKPIDQLLKILDAGVFITSEEMAELAREVRHILETRRMLFLSLNTMVKNDGIVPHYEFSIAQRALDDVHADDISSKHVDETEKREHEWVGLTDEDIKEGAKDSWVDYQAFQSVAWWADELLESKNT